MSILTRRSFTCSLGTLVCVSPALNCIAHGAATADHHVISMRNSARGDTNKVNVFEPQILRITAGDSITFLATDSGHNSASKKGMIPRGARHWNGGIDEELTISPTVPGVYGHICVPHYEWGMVGLIIVDDDLSNLQSAKRVRHPGDARKNFRMLFKQVEAASAPRGRTPTGEPRR